MFCLLFVYTWLVVFPAREGCATFLWCECNCYQFSLFDIQFFTCCLFTICYTWLGTLFHRNRCSVTFLCMSHAFVSHSSNISTWLITSGLIIVSIICIIIIQKINTTQIQSCLPYINNYIAYCYIVDLLPWWGCPFCCWSLVLVWFRL